MGKNMNGGKEVKSGGRITTKRVGSSDGKPGVKNHGSSRGEFETLAAQGGSGSLGSRGEFETEKAGK